MHFNPFDLELQKTLVQRTVLQQSIPSCPGIRLSLCRITICSHYSYVVELKCTCTLVNRQLIFHHWGKLT